ncbi:MAG: CocE/NonD family hydrolase [Armatimonadetes bacterium]|nr:CocE/NonD family hydrolase [Armatimonadota bacterium]
MNDLIRLMYCLLRSRSWWGAIVGILLLMGRADRTHAEAPLYDYRIEQGWMTMSDGIRLSVTYYLPVPRYPDEKFPALLEILPYRKDDMFYLRDHPLYSYFVQRGYGMVKVDVRGTGSSEGSLPLKEYSDRELDDAVEVIEHASKLKWSNGRVGMWGISWGGFNAIQVAMRQPPALKAILAVDASDDLYHDDIHYLDGILHFDEYQVSIDLDNGLPDSLEYRIDDEYFRNRFDREPWLLTYMRKQLDGPFWRKGSFRFQPEKIKVPVYLIGGLLDYYRDSVPRMLESLRAPVKAEIGPWNHAWPDNGVPGPNYEWRANLVRWWDHWLKDRDTGILDEPRFAVFIREGHRPDANLKHTPGHWRYEDWPVRRTRWKTFYPAEKKQLMTNVQRGMVERLIYQPGRGTEAGLWWGDPTGDVRNDSKGALIFDSPVLSESVEILGFPHVQLEATPGSSQVNWSVRLEDVHPDDTVSLVTGANLNGSQRESRLSPTALTPGKGTCFSLDLHFTTWTFQPGHQIRLSISNAQFPMSWPSPHPMTTALHLGERSLVKLPVIPFELRKAPAFPPPAPREERTNARWMEAGGWPETVQTVFDPLSLATSWIWQGSEAFEILDRQYLLKLRMTFLTHGANPADSRFFGEGDRLIRLPDREIRMQTRSTIRSEPGFFNVHFTRQLSLNGRMVRKKTWQDRIPRRFQ